MERNRSIDSMAVQAIMDSVEWGRFCDEIGSVAEDYPDILGVLAIGSLVQSMKPSKDFFKQRRNSSLGYAYESIRNPHRRKVFPDCRSDIDIWICVKDTKRSSEAARKVDLGGMSLLEELASGTISRGTNHWRTKKEAVFGDYYKKPDLYPDKFVDQNKETLPWMAEGFKHALENRLVTNLSEVVSRVHQYFDKRVPGDFVEVRAFPQSLFNLRPDDVIMPGGVQDRMPFPRIADDQWIGPDHASVLLYKKSDVEIYPFQIDGSILGSSIGDFVESYGKKFENKSRSLGGFLIKPDAVAGGQVDIVMDMITRRLLEIDGKVVVQKFFDLLSPNQIEDLYPLLRGSDLKETIEYIGSGPVIGLIVELPMNQKMTFNEVNKIKGPRVGDRSEERLFEGRITTGGIRDLLPLPGDEEKYAELIPTILRKRTQSGVRFTDEEYAYYSRNLIHTPDNCVELEGLLNLFGWSMLVDCFNTNVK